MPKAFIPTKSEEDKKKVKLLKNWSEPKLKRLCFRKGIEYDRRGRKDDLIKQIIKKLPLKEIVKFQWFVRLEIASLVVGIALFYIDLQLIMNSYKETIAFLINGYSTGFVLNTIPIVAITVVAVSLIGFGLERFYEKR